MVENFKKLLFVSVLFLSINCLFADTYSSNWIEKKVKNNPKGDNREIFSFENRIYLVEGLRFSDMDNIKMNASENDNNLYTLNGDKWKSLDIPRLNTGEINMGGALIKDKIWFFGSFNVLSKKFSGDTSMLDLKKMKYEKIETEGKAPYFRYDHSMTGLKVGEDIYFILMYGGMVNDSVNGTKVSYLSDELFLLSNKCLHWEKIEVKESTPGKRKGASFVTVGRNMYLSGGIDENGNYLDDLWLVNPFGKDEVFSKIQTGRKIIPAAYRASTVVEDRYILLIGGEAKINGKIKSLNNVDVYDTYENSWYELEKISFGISTGSALISDSIDGKKTEINCFGGKTMNSKGNWERNDNFYIYSFAKNEFYKYLK